MSKLKHGEPETYHGEVGVVFVNYESITTGTVYTKQSTDVSSKGLVDALKV